MAYRLFYSLLFVLTGSLVVGQTADEIITRSFEKLGGEEVWKAMEVRKTVGTMSIGGADYPGVYVEKTPNLIRFDLDFQGQRFTQAYDGETAWMVNPFAGASNRPKKLTDEEAADLVEQPFEPVLLNYAEKAHSVSLEGIEDINGRNVYKIVLTKSNGDVQDHFFDVESYLPVMVRKMAKSGPARGTAVETYLSDYREVEGALFPFSINERVNGQPLQTLTIDEVIINADVEDAFFAFPEQKPSGAENLPKIHQSEPGKLIKSTKKN